jgi:hypothetical protein
MRQLIRQLVRVEAVAVVVIAWVAGALLLGLATGAGAVPTAALMALGPLLGGLLLLIMHSLELARRIGNLSGESTRTLTTVRRVESGIYKVEREIKQTFRQLETMQNLGAMLPANDVLPATRGWQRRLGSIQQAGVEADGGELVEGLVAHGGAGDGPAVGSGAEDLIGFVCGLAYDSPAWAVGLPRWGVVLECLAHGLAAVTGMGSPSGSGVGRTAGTVQALLVRGYRIS